MFFYPLHKVKFMSPTRVLTGAPTRLCLACSINFKLWNSEWTFVPVLRAPVCRAVEGGPDIQAVQQKSSLSRHSKNCRESLLLQHRREEASESTGYLSVFGVYGAVWKIWKSTLVVWLLYDVSLWDSMCVGLSGVANALCIYISVFALEYWSKDDWKHQISKGLTFHIYVVYLLYICPIDSKGPSGPSTHLSDSNPYILYPIFSHVRFI